MSRLVLLALFATLLGCPTTDPTDDDDATLDDWTLQIDNNTANSFNVLQQRPCPSTDPDDFNELALPAGGLASGDTWRWLLPTPGCFFLSMEGEGCFAETEAGPLSLGEQYVWQLTDADLLCQGG
ncbi:MAG: hypothetical protein KDA24_19160 [Deltaproteobacteria bacterium]|nr:hypothetical protein [Deltaproteobacteria bacterium]